MQEDFVEASCDASAVMSWKTAGLGLDCPSKPLDQRPALNSSGLESAICAAHDLLTTVIEATGSDSVLAVHADHIPLCDRVPAGSDDASPSSTCSSTATVDSTSVCGDLSLARYTTFTDDCFVRF